MPNVVAIVSFSANSLFTADQPWESSILYLSLIPQSLSTILHYIHDWFLVSTYGLRETIPRPDDSNKVVCVFSVENMIGHLSQDYSHFYAVVSQKQSSCCFILLCRLLMLSLKALLSATSSRTTTGHQWFFPQRKDKTMTVTYESLLVYDVCILPGIVWRHSLSEVYFRETNARYYSLIETIV